MPPQWYFEILWNWRQELMIPCAWRDQASKRHQKFNSCRRSVYTQTSCNVTITDCTERCPYYLALIFGAMTMNPHVQEFYCSSLTRAYCSFHRPLIIRIRQEGLGRKIIVYGRVIVRPESSAFDIVRAANTPRLPFECPTLEGILMTHVTPQSSASTTTLGNWFQLAG